MHSILTYIIAAVIGFALAYFISGAPELRLMRLSQLVFIPLGMVLCVYFSPTDRAGSVSANMSGLVGFLSVLFFMVLLLTPNIAHLAGVALSSLIDPGDWTPLEEELALRPIRQLIQREQYRQALEDLEVLLKKHKPTYEAVHVKAQLLYHFGRVDETEVTLLSLIHLSQSTRQQMAVMELLSLLEPLYSHARSIEIDHELILFPTVESEIPYKEIYPGTYEVEVILHRNRRWLKLVGEDWGNAEICWKAIRAVHRVDVQREEKSVAAKIATAIRGKTLRQNQADAQGYLKKANQFIRTEDWQNALPLLQKASARDPDKYEIAYRWVQAVRHTASDAVTARAVSRVLRQSQWSENERNMLEQLKEPLSHSER